METIKTNYDWNTAVALVKTAFERTRGIKTYTQEGNTITGKTGASLGSYGEQVLAECVPPGGNETAGTIITVTGEKEVDMNITANPQKYVQRFVSQVHTLNGQPPDQIMAEAQQILSQGQSKEVADANQQASGQWLVYLVVAVSFLFFFMMMASL